MCSEPAEDVYGATEDAIKCHSELEGKLKLERERDHLPEKVIQGAMTQSPFDIMTGFMHLALLLGGLAESSAKYLVYVPLHLRVVHTLYFHALLPTISSVSLSATVLNIVHTKFFTLVPKPIATFHSYPIKPLTSFLK